MNEAQPAAPARILISNSPPQCKLRNGPEAFSRQIRPKSARDRRPRLAFGPNRSGAQLQIKASCAVGPNTSV
uniref:p0028E10.26 protein n=1 Tax=Oryza sativa subsp. japonica TaxID=39947 RepID=Q9AS66_ORYSJ|nr:P0028E10.26 [Oryza sativa Japonica Group]